MGLEIRKRLRLRNYYYSLPGAYFITICTWHRRMFLGSVVEGKMELSEYGAIARQVWSDLPRHFARLEPDAFVVMPNHVHIVLVLKPVVATGRAERVPYDQGINLGDKGETEPPRAVSGNREPYDRVSAPLIINQYKSYVTKAINQLRKTPKAAVWQRSYRDHVIRDENDLHYIREYIQFNPLSWDLDRDNPAAVGSDEFDNWLQKLKGLPEIRRGAR